MADEYGNGFSAILGSLHDAQDRRFLNQQRAFQNQQNDAAMAASQRTQAALPQIGDQLNAGNYSGAEIAAAVSGNKDLAATIHGLAANHRQQLSDYAGTIGSISQGLLQGYPVGANGDIAARQAAFDAQVGALRAHGATDADIAQARANLTDAALNGYINSATTVQQHIENAAKARDQDLRQADQNKPISVGEGGTLFDPVTRQPIYTAPVKPEVRTITNADGSQSLVPVDFGSGGASFGAPQGGVGGESPTASPASSGMSRPQRNNNPGNVRALPNGQQWRGQTGTDDQGFAIFGNQQDGLRAADRNLATYGRKGFNTVQSIISRWAPKADRNDTDAYIRSVSQALGVAPDTPLNLADPAVRQQLLQKGIYPVETGGSSSGKPRQHGVNFGQPFTTGGGSSGGGAGGLSQDAIDFAAQMGIANGGKIPAGFARNKAAQAAITNRMAELSQGKTPDQVIQGGQTTASQGAAFKAWNSGRPGTGAAVARSTGVAIEHLDQAQQAAQALQNGNVPVFNRIAQGWARETGSAAPTNFAALKDFVTDEVTKAVLGSAGGVGDREKAASIIAAWQSPAQTAGAVKQLQGLMASQLHGLGTQYQQTTGRNDFNRYLTPRAQALYGNGGPGHAPSGHTTPQGWKIKVVN